MARELEELCEEWREAPFLCLDTEFVRTRTFFARLGLIQVNDGQRVLLLDTVALRDLEPFADLLAELDADVVLHSCGEDMGIFAHRLGVLPERVFDTQIVASLVGLGFSVSYQALVDVLLGEHVSKGETRSDWTARPLSSAQLRYAAADVEYLPAIYRLLLGELRERGRESWAREELDALVDPVRYAVEPEEGWRRIKGGSGLDRRAKGALRELCTWRDREAMRRDLARNFVVRDSSLLELARRRPTKASDLRGIRDLNASQCRRYGHVFLETLERVEGFTPEKLPPETPRGAKIPRQKELVRALQEQVARVGEELEIAPEILCQRRVLEALTRRVLGEQCDELPDELLGWRAEVIGGPMLEALKAHRSGVKLA